MSRMQTLAGPAQHPRTFIDLLETIDDWTELPVQTRRVLKSNVRTAGFLAAAGEARQRGRSSSTERDDAILATVPVDIVWLNARLYAFAPELSGCSSHCRNLSVSGLRRVLRHVDRLAPYTPSTTLPPDSRWRRLLDALDDTYCQTALSTFATWCHSVDTQPEDVSAATLEAFETHVRTRTLDSEIPRLIRGVCKAWLKARHLLQAGPGHALTAPSRRETYVFKISDFPQTFQADFEAFRASREGNRRSSPFRGDGPKRPLRPKTITAYADRLREAASALVHKGRPIEEITSLAILVEKDAFEAILMFFWERAVAKATALKQRGVAVTADQSCGRTFHTGGIAATLMVVARHYCKVAPKALERLREMTQDVTPSPQTQLSPKNRERLRQFEDPVTRAKMLHLPRRLMKLAEADELRPLEAARIARIAAAIEILLHVPLRNANLTGLMLGTHLRYGSSGRIRHIVLQQHDTKNSYAGEWGVGPELAEMLDWYIKRFRPILNTTGSDALFPAGFGKPGPLSLPAMYQHIVRTVAEEVGAVVNPHLFRCLCAMFILEQSPEAMEDVRLMIGDKSMQIVLAYYNASQPKHAAKRTYETLRRLRAESASLVADVGKRRRKTSP